MPGRDYLGEFEHIVVLALLRLEDRAYGVPVRQEIELRTKREVSIGAVYAALDRLETKGYVKSHRAKKDGMAYVGHVPIYISAKEASVAGQRSIEHLSEILFACSSDESNLRKQLIASAIGAEGDRVRKDQMIVVNTFNEHKCVERASSAPAECHSSQRADSIPLPSPPSTSA